MKKSGAYFLLFFTDAFFFIIEEEQEASAPFPFSLCNAVESPLHILHEIKRKPVNDFYLIWEAV